MNVIEACKKLNVDVLTLFRIAYLHVFDKAHPNDCWDDFAQFQLHAVVPKYAQKFLKTL